MIYHNLIRWLPEPNCTAHIYNFLDIQVSIDYSHIQKLKRKLLGYIIPRNKIL